MRRRVAFLDTALPADQHDGEGQLAVEPGEAGECALGELLAVAQRLLLDVQLGMVDMQLFQKPLEIEIALVEGLDGFVEGMVAQDPACALAQIRHLGGVDLVCRHVVVPSRRAATAAFRSAMLRIRDRRGLVGSPTGSSTRARQTRRNYRPLMTHS